jgi:hypothetical protein
VVQKFESRLATRFVGDGNDLGVVAGAHVGERADGRQRRRREHDGDGLPRFGDRPAADALQAARTSRGDRPRCQELG